MVPASIAEFLVFGATCGVKPSLPTSATNPFVSYALSAAMVRQGAIFGSLASISTAVAHSA